MEIDKELIHRANKIGNGANIHNLGIYIATYENWIQNYNKNPTDRNYNYVIQSEQKLRSYILEQELFHDRI